MIFIKTVSILLILNLLLLRFSCNKTIEPTKKVIKQNSDGIKVKELKYGNNFSQIDIPFEEIKKSS